MLLPSPCELVDFVTNSNKIEGEPTDTAHPLFQSHLAACQLVIEAAESGWPPPHPRRIHEVLMVPEPHKMPGQYRPPHDERGPGQVGKEPLTPAYLIGSQMVDLWDEVCAVVSAHGKVEDAGSWAWSVHDRFERIHPFLDGNGRVGRILMNQLRLQLGLPWLTVRFEDREQYMARFAR